ncbi:UDP-N-acetylmuramoyl-tripeptide--D-alanyl-D-alanine ligase [Zhouia amylolytica]|uniref:UDP-N-acetylmuramoyl-tripeptide--D-alanyl-D- alanine ligase n=1 Tax=Zhouia amylolytica TaxID=376730 RepID=UPI0020CC2BF2|nr:UDP-N-acetylmuramoyl-tripeptide--D-alanyl-D-alanine ligase [Zhouia amylolytica]MCQ0112915.1 UDP-N-acetylmuramoyl-tripeptide--D-alanyl-D-alanine ligase [Zhouia amylolytica]
MNIEDIYKVFLKCNKVCTDTRKLEKGDLFFALKGDNFNGNKFAHQALQAGAIAAVIDEEQYKGPNTIHVTDTLNTLQQLASYHRKELNTPIIALTGSNGKTTTKELINAVLSQKYKTTATVGNLNNHIGVPLTLLSMDHRTEIGIVEMGANHLKEIAFLTSITQPDYGFITNFGKAHLEGFGGIEGVIQGKSELFIHLISNNKTIFYNADDRIQQEKLEGYPNKYGFSEHTIADIQITNKETTPYVTVSYAEMDIHTNLIGNYNFSNIAVAITIGLYFDIDLNSIKKGVEAYVPSNNRSQIINKNGKKIILDAYNANPTSMKVAIENFAQQKGKKILILGDMFELGKDAAKEHQIISDLCSTMGFEIVHLVGKNFYNTKNNFIKHETYEDLARDLDVKNEQSLNILIKGSRGMALERTLDLL